MSVAGMSCSEELQYIIQCHVNAGMSCSEELQYIIQCHVNATSVSLVFVPVRG